MSYDIDDPKLTAYTLGELEDEIERARIAAAVRNDEKLRREVEQVKLLAGQICGELLRENESVLAPSRLRRGRRILAYAIAACLAVGVTLAGVGLWELVTRGLPDARKLAVVTEKVEQANSLKPQPTEVRVLVRQAQQLVRDGRYRDALESVDQILVVDPSNEYAQGARPLIEDRALFQEAQIDRARYDALTAAPESSSDPVLKYNDTLRYPESWPELSATRGTPISVTAHLRQPQRTQEQATRLSAGDGDDGEAPRDDREVAHQLERRLPEARFDNSSFGDTVEFLRDVGGTHIFVNWSALERAGITRDTPVTVRMRDAKFSVILRAVLDDIQNPNAPLNFAVEDGMITISTRAELPHDFNTESYDRIIDNPFLDATTNPLSTFSIDVDTASYSNIRRFITSGQLPPKDAVRIEEMLNYFTYDYPAPRPQPEQGGDEAPFSSNIEIASCPWNAQHRLVRIGLKGREIAQDQRPATNLVFLIDVSGSMEPENKLPLLRRAMKMLVDQLGENDRVAIAVYAGSSGLVLPSTSCQDKRSILNALDQLQAGGSTNGAQGIELAYQIAMQHFIKGGVNRVILCTDGDFNVGITDQGALTRLIEEKAKTGVFLSVLGFGMGNVKDSTMEKLADKGNGNYAYIDALNEAKKVLVEQMSGTLVTIAKDVKIQVEFNPATVAAYRLVGYENRMLAKEDFNDDAKDAGEIGAGHTVTALYEVVPAGRDVPNPATQPVDALKYQTTSTLTDAARAGEMLTLKLRYKQPHGDTSKLLQFPVKDAGARYADASGDFKFAASVAAFGMILRDSPHKGQVTLDGVIELAAEGKGGDESGYRAEFIDLVRRARDLSKR